MTWITMAVGRASSPRSRADAERPERLPTRSVGTISVISSTPIMPMLVLRVIPESCCDHGLWEAACRRCVFSSDLSVTELTQSPASRLPRVMHSVSHFRFSPRFARLADLCITMSAAWERSIPYPFQSGSPSLPGKCSSRCSHGNRFSMKMCREGAASSGWSSVAMTTSISCGLLRVNSAVWAPQLPQK